MNLPNKLTILRMIMIPFFLVALMVPGIPGGKMDCTCVILSGKSHGYAGWKNRTKV